MKKYKITGQVTLDVERVIEADDEEDAWERAEAIHGDEWTQDGHYIMGEAIEIDDVVEEKPVRRKRK